MKKLSNLHRIVWFDDQVRRKRYPNSTSLAERYEISNRQALRDIDYLVNSMGAPLQYIPKKRGYEYTEKTYILPYQVITEEEQKILSFLSYRYGQYRYENSTSDNRLSALFSRLAGKNPKVTDNYPVFSVHPFIIETIHIISHAIEQQRQLFVYYFSEEHQAQKEIIVEPITILFQGNIDYLVAFNIEKNMEEHIDLTFITEVTLLDEPFERKKSKAQPLEKSPYVARIEFRGRYEGTTWQGYKMSKDKENVYDLEFYDLELFLNQVMGSSNTIKLLGPQWLKDQLIEKCLYIIKE